MTQHSWPKTKLQNIGSGPEPPDISVDGNTVESVDSFVYLGMQFTIIGWTDGLSSKPKAVSASSVRVSRRL